jgi:hypothetical protein
MEEQMRKAAVLAALLLSGCGGGLLAIGPDGATHEGTFDAIGKSMSVNIRGEQFSGPYILGGYAGGSNGRALLVSPSGSSLNCEFTYQGMSAIGSCQSRSGNLYQIRTR